MKDHTEKYTLTKQSYEDGKPTTKVEISFEAVHLDDMLMYIDMFLKGSGYVYKGELQIWENDE